jgi:hypothetical protein
VLRLLFGSTRQEVTEDWKKFRNEKIQNVTAHCMLLGDAIKDELNEQRMVGNRISYSIVVCIVA